MEQNRLSPPGQGSERPLKRSKRQAHEAPEFSINELPLDRTRKQGRKRPHGSNQPSKAILESSQIDSNIDLPDVAEQSSKKTAEHSVPSRQTLISSYMKLSMPILQFHFEQLMNEKPKGSKKALATSMADRVLSTIEWIPKNQTPPPPSPRSPTGHNDPTPAQPAQLAPNEQPGKELGPPELSLEEINLGRADRNFDVLFKFWYQLFTSNVPESQQIVIRPEQSEDHPEYLDDSTIARAIVALTGARSVKERYGLVAPAVWELAGGYGMKPTSCQEVGFRFVRPRCLGIFLHTYRSGAKGSVGEGQEGHHILVRVQVEQSGGQEPEEQRPRIYIYDSAPHFIGQNRDAVVQDIERRLHNLQWLNWPLPAHPRKQFLSYDMVPVASQAGIAECGVHTIVNGWVAALGLTPAVGFRADRSFYWYLRCLINMGMHGFVDTRTIYSFLKACGYIQQTDALPAALDVKLRCESTDGGTVDELYEAERDWEDFTLNRTTQEIHQDDLAAEQNTEGQCSQPVSNENKEPSGISIVNKNPADQASEVDWAEERLELHRGPLKVPWSVLGLFADWELEYEAELWAAEGKPIDWHTRYPAGSCYGSPSCNEHCQQYFEESDE